jgi:transposase
LLRQATSGSFSFAALAAHQGQITKLKALKRQMFGCAKLDLLRARLIVAG